VVGVSVDSTVNTGAWERKIGPIDFPLCSDFYPHGEVARKYGVFREGPPIPGISERAVFVLDKDARIVFVRLYGFDEVPDNAECFAVLNSLRLRQEASSA
jgi:peroxiredoxin